ncbi:HNH endonuclease [Carbonactinospora thermoautotrophica]
MAGKTRCVEHLEDKRAYNRARRTALAERTPEQIAADRSRLRPNGLKRCRKCRERLPFEAFAVNVVNPDGLHYDCRTCANTALLRRALPRWSELDTWTCVYCGQDFAHVDHVVPVSRGGTDDPANLAPACQSCNISKNATPVLAFIDRQYPGLLDQLSHWPVRYVELVGEVA